MCKIFCKKGVAITRHAYSISICHNGSQSDMPNYLTYRMVIDSTYYVRFNAKQIYDNSEIANMYMNVTLFP